MKGCGGRAQKVLSVYPELMKIRNLGTLAYEGHANSYLIIPEFLLAYSFTHLHVSVCLMEERCC
jgi:hypothetical protein